jgi:AAA15 family ATPase/GTPase
MLANVHIQNFRCFEDFEASGFERVNLIGGKNNSGKTCLLEAILSLKYGFGQIATLRNETWVDSMNVNFKQETIKITTTKENINYQVSMTPQGAGPVDSGIEESIQYIKVQKKFPDFDVAQKFDFINKKKLENELLNAINYIDNNIDGLRTFGENGLKLFISTKGEEWKSITSYGDAITHLVNYFSFLLAKKSLVYKSKSILLIDEIENGIHYKAHYDFWKNIFKLSKELDVQIFATTHSLEMIQQFNKVAKEEGEAAYFEMFRNEEENKIKCIKHETDILEYELETKENFRGEQL